MKSCSHFSKCYEITTLHPHISGIPRYVRWIRPRDMIEPFSDSITIYLGMTVGSFIVGFTRLLSTTYENNCYHDAHQKDSFPTGGTVFQLDNLLVCQQSHNTAIFNNYACIISQKRRWAPHKNHVLSQLLYFTHTTGMNKSLIIFLHRYVNNKKLNFF